MTENDQDRTNFKLANKMPASLPWIDKRRCRKGSRKSDVAVTNLIIIFLVSFNTTDWHLPLVDILPRVVKTIEGQNNEVLRRTRSIVYVVV